MAAVHIMSLACGSGERGHCQARLVSGDVFFILRVNVELRKQEEEERKKKQLVVFLQIITLTTVAAYALVA